MDNISSDDSCSSPLSDWGECHFIAIGDPDTEQPTLEIDFSEIAAIKTNLKDVHLRLTNAYEKLKKVFYHLYYAENEIENILSQIREIITEQWKSSRSLKRQIPDAIDNYLKNFREDPVSEGKPLNTTLSGYVNGLLRQEMTRCLKDGDLTKLIKNTLEAESVKALIREKMSKCVKEERLPESLKNAFRSKDVGFSVRPVINWVIQLNFKETQNSNEKRVKSEESNVVDNSSSDEPNGMDVDGSV